MMTFVTLFDSFYLDKGLVLYDSLEKAAPGDFRLYIFCFDEKSKEILDKEKCSSKEAGKGNLENAVILSHKDLERKYPKLLKLKEERSKAEYCWTCTPASIEYVLNEFDEESCTYIDADLYFFANPQPLFEEIEKSGADIVITPHRFSDSAKDRRIEKRSGKYCVEFNYFNRSNNAAGCLSWWKERCFEWCFHLYEEERMGDQKYLMKFSSLFDNVHELKHLGGGVAPWNFAQYEAADESGNIVLREKKSGEEFALIFYHFQNIRFISETKLNISSETHDKKTKLMVYMPYLKEIFKKRDYLKESYDVDFGVKKIYSSNKLIGFLQGTILRFRVKSLSDIVDMKKETVK